MPETGPLRLLSPTYRLDCSPALNPSPAQPDHKRLRAKGERRRLNLNLR